MVKTKQPRKGRPSMYAGCRLHKVTAEGLRNGRRRAETYKSIKSGMTYEAFVDAGGVVTDLKALIEGGHVEAKFPGDK